MLGIGIDYAIQMHARIEEEVIIDRAAHPIQETARNLGPALLVVTFDAVFAFAALQFAQVPMIRDFGSCCCVGIVVICSGRSCCPWPPSASASTARPPRAATSARARWASCRQAGLACPWTAVPFAVAVALFFAGGCRRGQAQPGDRPDGVGRPGLARSSRTSTRSRPRPGPSPSSALHPATAGVFYQRPSPSSTPSPRAPWDFSHGGHPTSPRRTATSSTSPSSWTSSTRSSRRAQRVQHRHHHGLPHRHPRRRARVAAGRGRAGGVGTGTRGHPAR